MISNTWKESDCARLCKTEDVVGKCGECMLPGDLIG
jgi:hypothetical protein